MSRFPYDLCLASLDSPFAREPASPFDVPRWSERHLQCVWYDDRLRPALRTRDGERIAVLQPGRWNLEAGPDFLGADLRIGRRRVRGDVEVHIRPSDWKAHGHDGDPRYADVVLHLTYYPATDADAALLPPHVASASLEAPLLERRGFALEDIDIAAYPHLVLPATPRPCGEALAPLGPDVWRSLLDAAGRHRMRRKAARMRTRLAACGDERQVFYEEAMAMLGAKGNTTPFRKVAELLPLSAWDPAASPDARYARLLGTAGLLPDPERMRTPEARDYALALRAEWFRVGGGADSIRDAAEWRLSGIRPANRPERRLAAAAMLFADGPRLDALLDNRIAPDRAWFRERLALLTSLPAPPPWDRRLAFDAAPGPAPVALLGRARAAVLLTNVLVPLLLARHPDRAEPLLALLPPEDDDAPGRETANRLFGRDHNPALYRSSGLLQQGLLAIHRDFCLRTVGGCPRCPLARYLASLPQS